MALITKAALSESADPAVLIEALREKYPETETRRTEQGLQIWINRLSLVPTLISPVESGILIATPFLPASEDLQLHADMVTMLQESDPEALFSNSEGLIIEYPDEYYTEERIEQWFMSETEKFFNLIRKDEDFIIPMIHRPFHAGIHCRAFWWKQFRSSGDSARDLLIHTLRKLQYPDMTEAPSFKVNNGPVSVKMVVFDNRSPLLLPPSPRLGFFDSKRKDLVTIPGEQLRNILPASWSMADEYYCLASVLSETDFGILIAKAAEIEKSLR